MGRFRLARALAFLLAALLESSGCARLYRAEGMVLGLDVARRTVTISHRRIPGYMDAMTMPFAVRQPRELDGIHAGTLVRFHLHVGKNESWISHLTPLPPSLTSLSAATGAALSRPVEALSVGEPAPDFVLTDQAGRTVALSQWGGKVVALNFIYTRCPLPEVCPRLAASFAGLQRRFRDRLGKDLILVSITLDPVYDTPEVLSRYADSVRAVEGGWYFLTGSPEDVAKLARRFGLVYWPEEGVIVHSVVTAIISPEGRLAASVDGSSFPLEQLSSLVGYQLAPANTSQRGR